MYKTVREGLDERCDDDDKANEFVENLRCLDTEEEIEAVRRCSDKHVKLLEKVAEFNFGQRTGPMCCAFQVYRQCAVDALKDACPPDQANYFQSILIEYVSESKNFVLFSLNSANDSPIFVSFLFSLMNLQTSLAKCSAPWRSVQLMLNRPFGQP